MKRIDLMKAQKVATGEWMLDPHSAQYSALNRQQFSTAPYTVVQSTAHRPDLVAMACYGKVDWWWVIAQFNGIINPLKELVVGRRLDIPNYAEVDRLFKQGKTTSRVGQVVEV